MIKYNYGPVDKSKKSAEPRIVLGNSESCSYWYSSPGTFLNAVYPTKNINKKYSKQKIMFLLIILYSLSVQLICPNQAHCITGVSVCICSWAGQIKPVNIYWAASGMRSGFSKISTSNKIDRKRREWSVVVIVQLHPRSGGCSGLYPCGTSYYALNLKIGAFSSKPQCCFGRCTISTIFWISKVFETTW